MRLECYAGIACLVIGCAGTAPPAPIAPAPASSAVTPAPATTGDAHTVSIDILRRWPFDDSVAFGAYFDFVSFKRTELVSGLVPAILPMARSSMSEVQGECVSTLIGAVRELAVGSKGPSERLGILRFDERAVQPGAGPCVQALLEGRPTKLPGASAAFDLGEDVVALKPGFLFFGARNMVEDALEGKGSGRWPADLDLRADEHFRWRFREPGESKSYGGSLASSHDFFRLELEFDGPSEAEATELEAKIVEAKKLAARNIAAQAKVKAAAGAVDALRVTRDGKRLAFVFELREPPVDQARDVGVMAALAVYGVRKHLLEAKAGEVRETLATIAKSEAAAWRDLPAGKRRIASLPPVPKEVPHGIKYQSSPDDWKAWNAVKFSIKSPQYFQYEVVASKDGKRADIVGRGDLNGDGKSSEFRLQISVNPARTDLDVAPKIEEKDPEE